MGDDTNNDQVSCNAPIRCDYEEEVIEIYGNISPATVFALSEITSDIKRRKQRYDNVILIISSTGGSASESYAAYDLLTSFCKKRKIVSLARGLVGSGALSIFLVADERYMEPHALLQTHHSLFSIDKLEIAVNQFEMEKICELLNKLDEFTISLLREKTVLSQKEVLNLLKSEYLVDRDKALKYGLITSLDNPFDLRQKIRGRK